MNDEYDYEKKDSCDVNVTGELPSNFVRIGVVEIFGGQKC